MQSPLKAARLNRGDGGLSFLGSGDTTDLLTRPDGFVGESSLATHLHQSTCHRKDPEPGVLVVGIKPNDVAHAIGKTGGDR